MKKNLSILILGVICFFGFQQVVFAQSTPSGGGLTQPTTTTNTPSGGGLQTPSGGTENPQKLDDPLGESTTIEGLLLSLFDIVFYIGVPVVAFFLIWSGFMFIAAQGNEEKLGTAKSRLVWTIVGAILLLGAWTISQAIKGTIINIKKGAISYLSTHTFS